LGALTTVVLIAGGLSGLSASIFLIGLSWVTFWREQAPVMIWGLPIAGFLIGYAYHRYGQNLADGMKHVRARIDGHVPHVLPWRFAPLIGVSTWVTHLVGGSAGREGTMVQMGAALTDRCFKSASPEYRRLALLAGASAGFGAATGAPWAGGLFALEHFGYRSWLNLIVCTLSSLVGVFITHLLAAPHLSFSPVLPPSYSGSFVLALAVAVFAFASTTALFRFSVDAIAAAAKRIPFAPLRPALGGLLLAGLFALPGMHRFAGLGLSAIRDAMEFPAAPTDFMLKLLFTAWTLGVGFKGGEFIPLVFVGSTLGSALAAWLEMPIPFFAALGFVTIYGAILRVPITCTVLAVELFGWQVGPWALIVVGLSSWLSQSFTALHARGESEGLD